MNIILNFFEELKERVPVPSLPSNARKLPRRNPAASKSIHIPDKSCLLGDVDSGD